MKSKKQLMIILGPTASGKSELAVFLAKQIKKYKWSGYQGAEIISADSRQVYKYLDVGTNKVTPLQWGHPALDAGSTRKKWIPDQVRNDMVPTYKSIPHYCIDFIHPRKTYTVAEYKIQAEKAIAEIVNRGNMPILVGGTGLYIQAVADGLLLPEVPPNKKLRTLLEKKSAEQLFGMLKKLDPQRAKIIDPKNPRRLIRAIEICKATKGHVPKLIKSNKFQTLFIGIKKNDEELKKILEKRSIKQIPELLKETRMLLKMKILKKRIREFGFEYKLGLEYSTSVMPDLIRHPENKTNGSRVKHGMTKTDLAEQLTKENWRYVKRQMTWFKRDKRIMWVKNKKHACQLVRAFLSTIKKKNKISGTSGIKNQKIIPLQ